MFKWLNNGRRNARPTPQTPRVQGTTALRAMPTGFGRRGRPAFLPATPEEQGFDSNTPRIDETA